MYDLLSKSSVLIIDDFAQFRATIKTMLHKLGARDMDQASNAIKAMKYCIARDYDIILCDYNMGESQDGQQFLEELYHRNMLLKGSLFLMITAETTSAQVMGAIEYRPDAYLTKPFTNEQLGQRLKRLLDRNESLKAIHTAIDLGDTRKALALCDAIMQQTPNLRFSCQRLKSEILEQQKKYDELMAVYDEVIQEQPLLWAVLGVGKIHYKQGDFSTALEHFQTMRENFPQQVSILDWIARCQSKLGETEQAESTLREAIDISPKSVNRQEKLGQLAQTLEHHDIAQRAFQRTIDEGYHSCLLKPQHYQKLYDNTRKMTPGLGKREQNRVLSQCENVARKMERKYTSDPTAMASNLGSLATLFSTAGRNSQAEGFLSKLGKALQDPQCRMDEDDFKHLQNNLQTLHEQGSYEKHLDEIDSRMRVIEEDIAKDKVNDKSARTVNREGMKFARENKPQQALEKFREAIRLMPYNSNYPLNASQVILTDEDMKDDRKLIAEARKYLQSISLEHTGTRWRLFKKLNELLNDD